MALANFTEKLPLAQSQQVRLASREAGRESLRVLCRSLGATWGQWRHESDVGGSKSLLSCNSAEPNRTRFKVSQVVEIPASNMRNSYFVKC